MALKAGNISHVKGTLHVPGGRDRGFRAKEAEQTHLIASSLIYFLQSKLLTCQFFTELCIKAACFGYFFRSHIFNGVFHMYEMFFSLVKLYFIN